MSLKFAMILNMIVKKPIRAFLKNIYQWKILTFFFEKNEKNLLAKIKNHLPFMIEQKK